MAKNLSHLTTVFGILLLAAWGGHAQSSCVGPVPTSQVFNGQTSGSIKSDADGAGTATSYSPFQNCSWTIQCPTGLNYIGLTTFEGQTSSSIDTLEVFEADGNTLLAAANLTFNEPLMLWRNSIIIRWNSPSGRNFNNEGWTVNFQCLAQPCASANSTSTNYKINSGASNGITLVSDQDGHRGGTLHMMNESCTWDVQCTSSSDVLVVKAVQDSTHVMNYTILDMRNRVLKSNSDFTGGYYYTPYYQYGRADQDVPYALDVYAARLNIKPQIYSNVYTTYYAYGPSSSSYYYGGGGVLPNPAVDRQGITVHLQCLPTACPSGITTTDVTNSWDNTKTYTSSGSYVQDSDSKVAKCSKQLTCAADEKVTLKNQQFRISNSFPNGTRVGTVWYCYQAYGYSSNGNYEAQGLNCYPSEGSFFNRSVAVTSADDVPASSFGISDAQYAVREYLATSYGSGNLNTLTTNASRVDVTWTNRMLGNGYKTTVSIRINYNCTKTQCFSPVTTGSTLTKTDGAISLFNNNSANSQIDAQLCSWSIQCPIGTRYLFMAFSATSSRSYNYFATSGQAVSATTTPSLTLSHAKLTFPNSTVELLPSDLNWATQSSTSYSYYSSSSVVMVDWFHLNITGKGDLGYFSSDGGATKDTTIPSDWNISTMAPPPINVDWNLIRGRANGFVDDASINYHCATERCSSPSTSLTALSGPIDSWRNGTAVQYAFGEVCNYQIRCPAGYSHIRLQLEWLGGAGSTNPARRYQGTDEQLHVIDANTKVIVADLGSGRKGGNSVTSSVSTMLVESGQVDVLFSAGYRNTMISGLAKFDVPGFSGSYACESTQCSGQRIFNDPAGGSINSGSLNSKGCMWSILCPTNTVIKFDSLTYRQAGVGYGPSNLEVYALDGTLQGNYSVSSGSYYFGSYYNGGANSPQTLSQNAAQIIWDDDLNRIFTLTYTCAAGTPVSVSPQIPTPDYSSTAPTCSASVANNTELTGTEGTILSDTDGAASNTKYGYPEHCDWTITCPTNLPYVGLYEFYGETASRHDLVDFFPGDTTDAEMHVPTNRIFSSFLEFDKPYMFHYRTLRLRWKTISGRKFNNNGWTLKYKCFASPCSAYTKGSGSVNQQLATTNIVLSASVSTTITNQQTGVFDTNQYPQSYATSSPNNGKTYYSQAQHKTAMGNQTCEITVSCPSGYIARITDIDARTEAYHNNNYCSSYSGATNPCTKENSLCITSSSGVSQCDDYWSYFNRYSSNSRTPSSDYTIHIKTRNTGERSQWMNPLFGSGASSNYYTYTTTATSNVGYTVTAQCEAAVTCPDSGKTVNGPASFSVANAASYPNLWMCQYKMKCPAGKTITNFTSRWDSYSAYSSETYVMGTTGEQQFYLGQYSTGQNEISTTVYKTNGFTSSQQANLNVHFDCENGTTLRTPVWKQNVSNDGFVIKNEAFINSHEIYEYFIDCGAPPAGQTWRHVSFFVDGYYYDHRLNVTNVATGKKLWSSVQRYSSYYTTTVRSGLFEAPVSGNKLRVESYLESDTYSSYSYGLRGGWGYQCHVTSCSSRNSTHGTTTGLSEGVIFSGSSVNEYQADRQSSSAGIGYYPSRQVATLAQDCLWKVQCPNVGDSFVIDSIFLNSRRVLLNGTDFDFYDESGNLLLDLDPTTTPTHGLPLKGHRTVQIAYSTARQTSSNYYGYGSSSDEWNLFWSCAPADTDFKCNSDNATLPTIISSSPTDPLAKTWLVADPLPSYGVCDWKIECPVGSYFQILGGSYDQGDAVYPAIGDLTLSSATSGQILATTRTTSYYSIYNYDLPSKISPANQYYWYGYGNSTNNIPGVPTNESSVRIRFASARGSADLARLSIQYRCSKSPNCLSRQSVDTLTSTRGTISSSVNWKPDGYAYNSYGFGSSQECQWSVECPAGSAFQIYRLTRRMHTRKSSYNYPPYPYGGYYTPSYYLPPSPYYTPSYYNPQPTYNYWNTPNYYSGYGRSQEVQGGPVPAAKGENNGNSNSKREKWIYQPKEERKMEKQQSVTSPPAPFSYSSFPAYTTGNYYSTRRPTWSYTTHSSPYYTPSQAPADGGYGPSGSLTGSPTEQENLMIYDTSVEPMKLVGKVVMDNDRNLSPGYSAYSESYTINGVVLPSDLTKIRLYWNYRDQQFAEEGWELKYLCHSDDPNPSGQTPVVSAPPTPVPNSPAPTTASGCPVTTETVSTKTTGFVGYKRTDPFSTAASECTWKIQCETQLLARRVSRFDSFAAQNLKNYLNGDTNKIRVFSASDFGDQTNIPYQNVVIRAKTSTQVTASSVTIQPQSSDYTLQAFLHGFGSEAANLFYGAKFVCSAFVRALTREYVVPEGQTEGTLVIVPGLDSSRRQQLTGLNVTDVNAAPSGVTATNVVSLSEAVNSSLFLSCEDPDLLVVIDSIQGKGAAPGDVVEIQGTLNDEGKCSYLEEDDSTTQSNAWTTTQTACRGDMLYVNYEFTGEESQLRTVSSENQISINYRCASEYQIEYERNAALQQSGKDKDAEEAIIIGASIGGAVFVIVVVAAVIATCCFCRSSSKKKQQRRQQDIDDFGPESTAAPREIVSTPAENIDNDPYPDVNVVAMNDFDPAVKGHHPGMEPREPGTPGAHSIGSHAGSVAISDGGLQVQFEDTSSQIHTPYGGEDGV